MTISNFRKHLIPSLALASAAFLGGAAGAGAADFTSDPQSQARQLLAPIQPARPVGLSGSSSVQNGIVGSVDPQELARQLLAGRDRSEHTPPAASAIGTAAVGRNASPGDGQALAQRMILGARGAAKTHTAITAAAHSRRVLE